MSQFEQFTILPGSIRRLQFANRMSAIQQIEGIEVTVQVRRKQRLDANALVRANKVLSRLELEEQYGASPKDLNTVLSFAEHFGLEVLDIDAGKRTVLLKGSSDAMYNAFKVHVFETKVGDNVIRNRVGPIFIPSELAQIVTGVFGLDNRPQAMSHLRLGTSFEVSEHAKPDAFDGQQLAAIYNFPVSDGKGQTIALIELGGGYLNTDIRSFFTSLNLPVPNVRSVSVNGGRNIPILDMAADTEVALDIQVAGAVSPGANIVVYFAPNDDQSFLQAVLAAIHDDINKPSIISISWGAAEKAWTEQQMLAMTDAFKSAAALGISVFCAAGDDGANDNVYDGAAHVDFPASSPFAMGCGGTTMVLVNGVRQESVWNDGDGSATGGGISMFFPVPDYQQTLAMPAGNASGAKGRGVPDVSAVADPRTGYAVFVHGHWTIVGGTSAVAPLYAGLAARLNERMNKPSGFMNTAIYTAGGKISTTTGGVASSVDLFNDIASGNNSVDKVIGYQAGPGWDAVTGWGSPDGLNLLNFFNQVKS